MSLLLALLAVGSGASVAPQPVATRSPQSADVSPQLVGPDDVASASAIVAGVKACVGIVVDPAGIDARFAGWSDGSTGMNADQIKDMKAAGGRTYMRDNVRIALQPGTEGGCIIIAGTTPTFDRAEFRSALGRALGTTVSATGPTPLPNGEIMSAELGERMAFIVVTSAAQAKAMNGTREP